MYVLYILYVFLVISIYLKFLQFLRALLDMMATILTKGKDGRPDDVSTIFAMGNHMTTTILTNDRSDDLTMAMAAGQLSRLTGTPANCLLCL